MNPKVLHKRRKFGELRAAEFRQLSDIQQEEVARIYKHFRQNTTVALRYVVRFRLVCLVDIS